MNPYDLSHMPDSVLRRELPEAYARQRGNETRVLQLISEWDARKLYLEAGYSSMFRYCLGELHMSEDETYKRIEIARKAREFPPLFAALMECRIHMTGALMLSAHLCAENAEALVAAATHKSKAGIEELLAHWFPRPDIEERVVPINPEPRTAAAQLAPERVASDIPNEVGPGQIQLAPERVAAAPTPVVLQKPSPPA